MTPAEIVRRLFSEPVTRARIGKAQALAGRSNVAWADVLAVCRDVQLATIASAQ